RTVSGSDATAWCRGRFALWLYKGRQSQPPLCLLWMPRPSVVLHASRLQDRRTKGDRCPALAAGSFTLLDALTSVSPPRHKAVASQKRRGEVSAASPCRD